MEDALCCGKEEGGSVVGEGGVDGLSLAVSILWDRGHKRMKSNLAFPRTSSLLSLEPFDD